MTSKQGAGPLIPVTPELWDALTQAQTYVKAFRDSTDRNMTNDRAAYRPSVQVLKRLVIDIAFAISQTPLTDTRKLACDPSFQYNGTGPLSVELTRVMSYLQRHADQIEDKDTNKLSAYDLKLTNPMISMIETLYDVVTGAIHSVIEWRLSEIYDHGPAALKRVANAVGTIHQTRDDS